MYLVCGEALFDVFEESDLPDGGLRFDARAGGSPFNVAIGIARLRGRSALLAGISRDPLGERLAAKLVREAVDTTYLIRSGRRTTLSLVNIGHDGQPGYVFYGLGSADCDVKPCDLPKIGAEISGLHFGSYSLVVQPVADTLWSLASDQAGRFISLDPNVRLTVEPDIGVWRDRVAAYSGVANLVKVSAEDIEHLYPNTVPEHVAADWISNGVSLVVVTDGGRGATAWSRNGWTAHVPSTRSPVIDTVGAGDSFQAALLFKLAEDRSGDPAAALAGLDSSGASELLRFAGAAAGITCGRRGADLPRADEMPLVGV